MSEKLKPCPFCGSHDVVAQDVGQGWWVYCRNCYAHGPFWKGQQQAEIAWNHREEAEGDG